MITHSGAATASMVSMTRVRPLLALATSKAVEDGRREMEPVDVLLALTCDEETASLLADLGVDEAAVRKAIKLHREKPPEASAED